VLVIGDSIMAQPSYALAPALLTNLLFWRRRRVDITRS
jgi:hypothetical protein